VNLPPQFFGIFKTAGRAARSRDHVHVSMIALGELWVTGRTIRVEGQPQCWDFSSTPSKAAGQDLVTHARLGQHECAHCNMFERRARPNPKTPNPKP